jgi:serine/threonine protein kinase/tetratricopeptide (TPR) repeat protein
MGPEDGAPGSELGSLAQLLRKVAATPGYDATLAADTQLGRRYTIVRLLGRGGMGTVYAVRDAELDELVALKLLHAELGADTGYQQRLRAEVRLARRVSHPNVCRVHDLGQEDGRLFVTMELVEGSSLRELTRAVRAGTTPAPSLATIVDVVVQIAAALSAAHRAGVLHRDVKPDNVVVDGNRAVLTDFGVASLAHDRDVVIAGTPAYMAPEILRGEPFDYRADVYSAAVLAYELVTGRLPFATRTIEAARHHAEKRLLPPPVPEALGAPPLRAALDRAFTRALDPEPMGRLASADQFAEAISHAARNTSATVIASRGSGGGDTPAASTPATTPSTIRRAELRVATVLVYRADRLRASTPDMRSLAADSTGDHPTLPAMETLTRGPAESLERIVVDAGGSPIAVSGLEITALFGAPISLGDDAERAARAAQALLAHRGGRAGLDTVRFAMRPGLMALSASDAIRPASTLANAARPGEILASPVTARQISARFDLAVADIGSISARRLVGERTPVPRPDAATFRARELEALEALAEDCFTNRHPRHGEVRGPAGFGKTQLRDALIARLRERREIEWIISRAPHGDTGPFELLRIADAGWYAAVDAAGLADRRAAFAAARRWLEVRAERRPVVVVLEDAQWSDELSRAFFDHLIHALDDVPVLVLSFTRSDDTAPSTGERDVIELGPLDDAAAGELARELAPNAPPDAIAAVVARAAGHPFFLEELARELAERGRSAGTMPATIEAVVQARLDRLDDASRDLLAAAAVAGESFARDALAPALSIIAEEPGGDAAIDASLAELDRLTLITPATTPGADPLAGESYRFVHGLVRDVAYARIAAPVRRSAHAKVASWLARQVDLEHRDTDVARISELAHHFEQGGAAGQAADAYRVAGQRCLEAAAYREATLALRKSAALAPAIDAELATQLGDATLHAETIAEAEKWYQRALDLTPETDTAGRALRWHQLGNAASRRADGPRAIQCFEAGLALAAPNGTLAPWATRDPRTAALLFGSLGWVAGYQLGDNERGLPGCQRAVDLLEGTPYRRELAHALSRLGATFMRASRFRDQLQCNRRNLEIGIEIDDVMMQLTARVNLGVVHGLVGEIDEAISHSLIARQLAARTGSRDAASIIESNLAGYYLECDRLDDAQRCLDEGMLSARAGSRVGLGETYGFVARLHAARGDLAGAELWARRALAQAESKLDQGIALRMLAQILARLGSPDARQTIEDAASRMANLDPYEQARTEAARARILRRAGDLAEADTARERARAELEQLGARRELAVLDLLDEVR